MCPAVGVGGKANPSSLNVYILFHFRTAAARACRVRTKLTKHTLTHTKHPYKHLSAGVHSFCLFVRKEEQNKKLKKDEANMQQNQYK